MQRYYEKLPLLNPLDSIIASRPHRVPEWKISCVSRGVIRDYRQAPQRISRHSIHTLWAWGYIWGYSCFYELLDLMLIIISANYSIAVPLSEFLILISLW